jgi:ribosomal protein S18 acetylase RimI-like enzyme
MGEIRLRSIAATDDAFLCALYASTRTEELAPVPWTEEQKRAFLEMQFRAQTIHYRTHYSSAQFLIIEKGDQPIGRITIDRRPGDIRIVDIALIPEYRGRGIGTTFLRELLHEAEASSKSVSIHVEQFNPAMRLYDRLGFRRIDSHGVYHLMEWRAPALK